MGVTSKSHLTSLALFMGRWYVKKKKELEAVETDEAYVLDLDAEAEPASTDTDVNVEPLAGERCAWCGELGAPDNVLTEFVLTEYPAGTSEYVHGGCTAEYNNHRGRV